MSRAMNTNLSSLVVHSSFGKRNSLIFRMYFRMTHWSIHSSDSCCYHNIIRKIYFDRFISGYVRVVDFVRALRRRVLHKSTRGKLYKNFLELKEWNFTMIWGRGISRSRCLHIHTWICYVIGACVSCKHKVRGSIQATTYMIS